MATKNTSDEKTVTRISASDDAAKKPAKAAKRLKRAAISGRDSASKDRGYFKGAWYELKQVHWPTRRATWSLTAAVLGFSAFFVIFILLLDALFKFAFEQVLK